jgi:predicted ArsR family transcriptional regulator
LPESAERKSAQAKKQGKRWHDPGSTRIEARRLYVKYPLLAASDIARILGVSRQAIFQHVDGLKEEREKLREEALVKLKRKEGLSS